MKFLLKAFLLSFLLLSFFLLWIYNQGADSLIRNLAKNYVSNSTNGRLDLQIGKVSVIWPLTIEIDGINVKQEEELVNIDKVIAEISPVDLLYWKINLENLLIQEVRVNPLIAGGKDQLASQQNSLYDVKLLMDHLKSLNHFLPNIEIKHFDITDIAIDEGINYWSQWLLINIAGQAEFNPRKQYFMLKTEVLSNVADAAQDKTKAIFKSAQLLFDGKLDWLGNNLSINQIAVNAPHTNIVGVFSVDYQQDVIVGKIEYSSSLASLLLSTQDTLVQSDGSGVVEFSGSITSPIVNLQGTAFLDSKKKNWFELPKLNWSANFKRLEKQDEIKFKFASAGFNGELDCEIQNQQFRVKNILIKGKKFLSKAEGSFGFNRQGYFRLDVTAEDLGELQVFFPFIKKGQLSISSDFDNRQQSKEQVNLKARVKSFVSSAASVELAAIDFHLNNFNLIDLKQASFSLRSLILPSASVKSLDFNAKGTQKIDFSLNLENTVPHLYKLNILGSANAKRVGEGDNFFALLETAITGKLGKHRIATEKPLKIVLEQNFSLVAPQIKLDNGNFSMELSVQNWKAADSEVKGMLKSSNLPISIFGEYLPDSFAKALVDGQLSLAGTLQKPVLTSKIQLSQIKSSDKASENIELQINSILQNHSFKLDAIINNDNQKAGTLKLAAPLNFTMKPFDLSFNNLAAMNLDLNLREKVNILSMLPLPIEHKLNGYLKGVLSLTGTVDKPNIYGNLAVHQAEYQYFPYGIKLKAINGNITANNKTVNFNDFSAADDYTNQLKVNGNIALSGNNPFTFTFFTEKFGFVNTKYLQGEVKGEFSIKGNRQKALAQGKVVLGPMEIKIPENFSADIPELNIIESVRLGVSDKQSKTQKPQFNLDLDIELLAGQQVYVRGWGVNTLLAGQLKITNNISAPYIVGQLRSVRGRYQEFGKSLTVKEGVLNFTGAIDPSPYLNIIGSTVVSNTEIQLILSGSIFDPDLSIKSIPELSQQNALSLLLFGKNPESVSPIQALGLADGLRKLSGHGGGFDPLGLGRKILPFDDINIRNDEETKNTSVGVGKYLTDKIYVELESGDQAAGSKARIEVEITPQISVESVTGGKNNNLLGVNWRYDY